MVTRKTRNYKEKKSIKTFGQLILPLAVIMLFALFFFSVKLFFMDPNDVYLSDSKTDSSFDSIKQNKQTQTFAFEEESTVNKSVLDEPVKTTADKVPSAVKPSAKLENVPVKRKVVAETKQRTVKKEDAKNAKEVVKQEESSTIVRWDVQVGGFKAKSGAEQILKETKAKGYNAYITSSTINNVPFYKVRVKGFVSKNETTKLAFKLESDGYPTYIVSTK